MWGWADVCIRSDCTEDKIMLGCWTPNCVRVHVADESVPALNEMVTGLWAA